MKTSYRLSMIAAILTALAATAGLFIPGLYQDSEYLITVWQGNDWVTLIVVVPALLITLYLSEQGSIKAWLIWMGLLLYLFYNYAFYLFATAFNAVFLAYVSLFAVSACALIYGLSAFPVQRISFGSKHLFWIAGYLLLIAFILVMVEVPPIIRFLLTGELPELIERTDHPTSVVYALDLSIVVPLSVLAAVWLWREKKRGYILAALMLVKGAIYGMVLTINTIILTVTGKGGDPLLPFYAFVVLGGVGGLFLLLKNVEYCPE
ncbi:MAG: hypothetical protein KDD06_07250 [Phaeodactylibacter sp.]|nr:hypothetical protein [Phaeodactylibacter sp.]MCB9266948.1 hypothetical protein [Lewinellaceae bacterium]MCB9291341.1 hypothetical protein [Lewinellaceae bacterium]